MLTKLQSVRIGEDGRLDTSLVGLAGAVRQPPLSLASGIVGATLADRVAPVATRAGMACSVAAIVQPWHRGHLKAGSVLARLTGTGQLG